MDAAIAAICAELARDVEVDFRGKEKDLAAYLSGLGSTAVGEEARRVSTQFVGFVPRLTAFPLPCPGHVEDAVTVGMTRAEFAAHVASGFRAECVASAAAACNELKQLALVWKQNCISASEATVAEKVQQFYVRIGPLFKPESPFDPSDAVAAMIASFDMDKHKYRLQRYMMTGLDTLKGIFPTVVEPFLGAMQSMAT